MKYSCYECAYEPYASKDDHRCKTCQDCTALGTVYMKNWTSISENLPLTEESLCEENENFIQNKFGYCFYTLDAHPLIYNLYVHPQYRRRGHSKELIKLVIREIRKSGEDGKIYIQACPRENSIGLADLTKYYERIGLTIYEARKPQQEEK